MFLLVNNSAFARWRDTKQRLYVRAWKGHQSCKCLKHTHFHLFSLITDQPPCQVVWAMLREKCQAVRSYTQYVYLYLATGCENRSEPKWIWISQLNTRQHSHSRLLHCRVIFPYKKSICHMRQKHEKSSAFPEFLSSGKTRGPISPTELSLRGHL